MNLLSIKIIKIKALLVAPFLFILLSGLSFAQEDSSPLQPEIPCHPTNNMISINTFGMLPVGTVNFYNISYVRKIDCTSAWAVEFRYPIPNGVKGYGFAGEYRWYPQAKGFKKFYLAPRFSYYSVADSETEAQVYSYGAVAAWQFILGDHFCVGMGFGIEYNTGPQLQQTELERGKSNVSPHFRLDFGWTW